MLKFITAVTMLLNFASCSFPDQGTMSDVQKDLTDRNKIVETFAAIEGVYEGEIFSTNQNRSEPARLILTYREVPVGTDNDGQIRYRPRLFARFNRPNVLRLDNKLEGVFEPVTGDITLSSLANEQEAFYIRTRLQTNRIKGTLRLGAQVYGVIDVVLVTRELPDDTTEDENQRQRIRRRLLSLAGEYQAEVTNIEMLVPNISIDSFRPETFSIRVSETQGKLPQLVLYYRKSNSFLVVQAQVDYRPELQPEEISFKVPRGTGPGQETFDFFGTWDKGVIEGRIVYPTFVGKLRAVKK
jgi:hypothetical protein